MGRVLGGAATSVLFSSFESWLVAQHELLGLPSDDLGASLSKMYFLNGFSGILMGLIAEAGADAAPLTEVGGDGSIFYVGGDITPFDVSLLFLISGGTLISCTWSENYAASSPAAAERPGAVLASASSALSAAVRASGSGDGVALSDGVSGGRGGDTSKDAAWDAVTEEPWLDSNSNAWGAGALFLCIYPLRLLGRQLSAGSPLAEGLARLATDPLLLLLMTVASTMEAAMYAFVLEWTPAVASSAGAPPLGIIFAAYMVAFMGGSTSVSILTRNGLGSGGGDAKGADGPGGGGRAGSGTAGATMLVYVCAAALVSLFSAFLLLANAPAGDEKPPGVAFSVFLALCCFEFCLGAYMPTVASVKAAWVPEDVRATVYGLFRVPLNLMVVIILLVSLSSATTFLICSSLLAVSLAAALLATSEGRTNR